MAKELGAKFEDSMPYFPSPTNQDDKIYLIWDPPHMLKLARGCLAHHQLYFNGKSMHWNFIANLHKMQQERNLNLGNKLTDMHINFHYKPMNVKIAAQTMSNSVADCVDQLCSEGYDEFKNSETTTEFIRYCNNIFDVSNFKPSISGAGNGFKQSLNPFNASEMFEYFAKAKTYFRNIEIDETYTRKVNGKNGIKESKTFTTRKLVIKSRNFTPFFGFIHNLTAFEELYTDYVLNGDLDELITFKFAQDHLETWFSSVRSSLGKFYYQFIT